MSFSRKPESILMRFGITSRLAASMRPTIPFIKSCGGSENLVLFPHQEHRRTNLTNRPLRFIHVRDYLIAYAPDEKPLWVIAFMHGYRNPRVMAAILRGRD